MQATVSTLARPRAGDRRALILALMLGALAAGLTVAYLQSLSGASGSAVPTRSVVVARDAIPGATKITDAMVEMKSVPEMAVMAGAITSKEQVVGQTLRYPVGKGGQFGETYLVDPKKEQALSFQIPTGSRGFTLPVNASKSPAALLVPGDFVDVLAYFEGETRFQTSDQGDLQLSDEPMRGAVTLLQNVQAISVQRSFSTTGTYDPSVRGPAPKDANVTYVTLAVTPEQAQLLTLAVQKAQLLTVSLRAYGDAEIKEIRPLVQSAPGR